MTSWLQLKGNPLLPASIAKPLTVTHQATFSVQPPPLLNLPPTNPLPPLHSIALQATSTCCSLFAVASLPLQPQHAADGSSNGAQQAGGSSGGTLLARFEYRQGGSSASDGVKTDASSAVKSEGEGATAGGAGSSEKWQQPLPALHVEGSPMSMSVAHDGSKVRHWLCHHATMHGSPTCISHAAWLICGCMHTSCCMAHCMPGWVLELNQDLDHDILSLTHSCIR